jgi:hypothetical protein
MSVINTGKTFANGEQLTADKLNQVIDQATFNASEAVDGSTITLISGAMAVNDSGITEAKIDNGAVTKAKIENVTDMKVLGNTSGSDASPQEVAILDEDTMSSNSATSLATQQSIKAYVDDLIDYSALPSQSGGLATEGEQGSYTLPGGLIVKYGTLDSNAYATLYTFTTAFPTAIIGVNATSNENYVSAAESCSVHVISETGFTLAGYQNNSGAAVGRVFWTAYGY